MKKPLQNFRTDILICFREGLSTSTSMHNIKWLGNKQNINYNGISSRKVGPPREAKTQIYGN